MKIKYSWIPFIPVAFISVFLRVYQVMFVQNGMDTGFLSSAAIWTIYTALVILLILFLIIFTAADKQTSPKYSIGKNFFAGLFALVTGLLLIYGGGVGFVDVTGSTVTTVMAILDNLFSLIGGVMFLIIGVSCVTGKNKTQKSKIAMILPVIWCCIRLVYVFMTYTTQAVHSIDMTNLFYIAFSVLFLYNFALLFTGLDGRNPVKACFLYGMPAITVALVYSAVKIVTGINSASGFSVNDNIQMLQFLSLSLFMIFFLIELTSKAQPKTAVEAAKESETAAPTQTSAENGLNAVQESVKNGVVSEEPTVGKKLTNVDESINEEMDDVNDVLENIENDENAADNADPRSDEYFKANNSVHDDDYEQSLDKINALISELSTEDNNK